MSFNLIIPVAADNPTYNHQKPYWMDIHPSGNLMLFETISGLDLQKFDAIYITMLKKHVELYSYKELLNRQFELNGYKDKLKIVLLDTPTRNQPETVAKTIEKEKIKGSIVIKDADNRFECTMKPGNFVCSYPLDALSNVNPADKSYINIDDSGFITNIVEKKIISRWFCCGAYGFEDSEQFSLYYEKYKGIDRLYISHLIYAMLLDKTVFHPINVSNYRDWGAEKQWKAFKNKYQTIFIPLNLIIENPNWITSVNKLFNSGKYYLILVQEKNILADVYTKSFISKLKFHHLIETPYLGKLSLITNYNEISELENML